MSYYGSFVLQCYVLRMRVMTSTVGGNLTNRPPALRHIHVNMNIVAWNQINFSSHGSTVPSRPRPPLRGSSTKLRHITLSRPPLDQWSARRRDLYLTKHNNHKTEISMLPAGFETTFSASERPQAHALDSAVSNLVQSRITSILKYDGYTHRLLHA